MEKGALPDIANLSVQEKEKETDVGVDRKLLVAVDFGTTFSGVAWAQTRRVCDLKAFTGQDISLTVSQPDVQTTIIQWPDASAGGLEGISSDKVPT